MRITRELQTPMFRQYSEHSFSDRLQKISAILDLHPEIADWVHSDLGKSECSRGSRGMSAESVVRAALVKQMQELTYDELEYQVADSQSARAFIRVPDGRTYSRSALQANIKAISLATWQRVQKITVECAASTGFETGKTVRIDATALCANRS